MGVGGDYGSLIPGKLVPLVPLALVFSYIFVWFRCDNNNFVPDGLTDYLVSNWGTRYTMYARTTESTPGLINPEHPTSESIKQVNSKLVLAGIELGITTSSAHSTG